MSLFDCLRPQCPPPTSGARLVRGPASITIAEAEAARPKTRLAAPAKLPAKMGRPRTYGPDHPEIERLLRCLRSLGAASKPAIVRHTGFPAPKVRTLLRVAKALGLATGREGRLWSVAEGV